MVVTTLLDMNVQVINPRPGGDASNVTGFEVVGADLNQVFVVYLPVVRR
jgi:hypothetical protein